MGVSGQSSISINTSVHCSTHCAVGDTRRIKYELPLHKELYSTRSTVVEMNLDKAI
jgi:hypothetical protein